MAAGSRKRNRQDLPIKAEINVTSLVDVAFTLLVIFMITAPMLQGGVEILVPEADVSPLTAETEPFIVTVQQDGQVFLAESAVDPGEVQSALAQMVRASGAQTVFIRGDARADYEFVLSIIAAVSQVEGITFSLVAEPIPNDQG